MKQPTIIIVAVTIIAVAVVIVGAFTFLNAAFAPLERRQDTSTNIATQNVEIQATTFNGNIEIQLSSVNALEIIYNVEAPKGHLNEIETATINQTKNQDNLILAAAQIRNSNGELRVNYRADILIKLPNTSKYNLTLQTQNGNIIKPLLNDIKVTASTANGKVDIKDDNCTTITASSQNGNVKISLVQGTLFSVEATTGNGNVSYQGIALNTTTQTSTHLSGNTSNGKGNLNLALSTANGNITIEYFSK